MTSTSSKAYLRDAVMTASPEQLQLMLYDGAIRFATQGREAIEAGDREQSFEKLTRAQRIVLEMERGLNHDIDPQLCDRMASLYMFVYRRLVDGCVQHDTRFVDDALEILRLERETWVLLIERLGENGDKAAAAKVTTAPVQPAHSAQPVEGGSLSIEG